MKRASRSALTLAWAIAFLVLPCAATAGPLLWISDSQNRLYTVDLDTGASTQIGEISANQTITDIAINAAGDLWAISFNAIWRVNKTTAEATLVGQHGVPGGNALAFDASGRLYAAGASSDRLYVLTAQTGAGSALPGSMGDESAGDIVFADGAVYLSSDSGELVKLLLSGPFPYQVAPVPIGSLTAGSVFGLALASDGTGQIYAAAGESVYRVNKLTAELTPIAQLPRGARAYGAASELGAPALLVPSATRVAFPSMGLGAISRTFSVRLSNRSGRSVTPGPISVSGDIQDFTVVQDECSGVLLTNLSRCSFGVVFSPQAIGLREASISVGTQPAGGRLEIGLRGMGSPAALSSSALRFGPVALSESPSPVKRVALTNRTAATITLGAPRLAGIGIGDYRVDASECTGVPLQPNSKCSVAVTFQPSAIGLRIAFLVIDTVPPSGAPMIVSLTGAGVDVPPASDLPAVSSISPASGPIGTRVTIRGTNFGDHNQFGDRTVRFGDVEAAIVESWTNTRIEVRAPDQEVELAAITIETPSGTSRVSRSFAYASDGDPCDELGFFDRNRKWCDIIGKLRDPFYLGIARDAVPEADLLEYVKQHEADIDMLFKEIELGVAVSRALNGGSDWTRGSETNAVKAIGEALGEEGVLTILDDLLRTMSGTVGSRMFGELLGVTGTVADGLDVFLRMSNALTFFPRKTLLTEYMKLRCGETRGRCVGNMGAQQAWQALVADPVFEPYMNLVRDLSWSADDNLPTYFEHLFEAARMSAYDDSDLYRRNIGVAIGLAADTR